MSGGRTMGLVPMSARFSSPCIQNQSVSGLDLILISLTWFPTNSRKDAESLLSMPSTAEESVKNLTAPNSICSESLIFCASLTASSDPISSILGMEILHLGATLVLPASSLHSTVPSCNSYLR
jgi:hypothetical protein